MSFRPELQKIRNHFGDRTLGEYLKEHIFADRNPKPLSEAAYETFQQNFKEEIKMVSTAGHLGVLEWDSPILLGENVVTNLQYALGEKPAIHLIPTSRIPFSNTTRPGALDLSHVTDPKNPSNHLLKYNIRSGRSIRTVDKSPKTTTEDMEPALEPLQKLLLFKGAFPSIDRSRLQFLANHIKQFPQYGSTFNEQCEALSTKLWPYLFEDDLAKKLKPPIIRAIEGLKMENENLIENKRTREHLEKIFKGVWGAFDTTYFYYGSCRCGIEFPLAKEEENGEVYLSGKCINKECEHHGKEKFSVRAKDITDAAERREVHEGLLMNFYRIWALAGIDVLGGFNQVEYIAGFREGLVMLFNKLGERKKAEIMQTRASNLFNAGLMVAFNSNGSPKTGSQVMLEGGLKSEYLNKLNNTKFGSMLDASNFIINSAISGKKPDYSAISATITKYGLNYLVM